MNLVKNLALLLCITIFLTACIEYNILPGSNKESLRKSGGIVQDCQGRSLSKNSPFTDRFWKENNLPKGTTDFICKNGKAYLPD